MRELARLFVLLLAVTLLWNLARGTLPAWLRAKFLGQPTVSAAGAAGKPAPAPSHQVVV